MYSNLRGGEGVTKRGRERRRQRDRDRDTERDRVRDRQKKRQRQADRDRFRDRQTETETDKQRHITRTEKDMQAGRHRATDGNGQWDFLKLLNNIRMLPYTL